MAERSGNTKQTVVDVIFGNGIFRDPEIFPLSRMFTEKICYFNSVVSSANLRVIQVSINGHICLSKWPRGNCKVT